MMNERSAPLPVLILGVGNILFRDEGVGVRVIEALEGSAGLENVELLDGGTAALDLINDLADRDRVIIIDAVKAGGQPGAIYRFTPDDIVMQRELMTSLHQVDLIETLRMTHYLGCAPREVVIFGIEPKVVDWGWELSPEITEVIPRVIELVLAELRRG